MTLDELLRRITRDNNHQQSQQQHINAHVLQRWITYPLTHPRARTRIIITTIFQSAKAAANYMLH